MSQNRNIKDFFGKVPSKTAPKSDKASINGGSTARTEDVQGRRKSSRTPVPRSTSRNLRRGGQRSHLTSPEPVIPPPQTYPSSSSLSSLPSSSLFQQSDRDIIPSVSVQLPSSEMGETLETRRSSASSHTEPENLPETNVQATVTSTSISEDVREIKGSDDEDDDSDSDSLPDFTLPYNTTAQYKASAPVARQVTPPRAIREKKISRHHQHSPLTVQPKYIYSLEVLAKEAKMEEAAEASSKRLQQLLEASRKPSNDKDNDVPMDEGEDDVTETMENGEVLDLLVGELDEEEVDRRKGVLKRTQAIVTENRWYFFNTESKKSASIGANGITGKQDNWIFDCVCGDRGKIDDGTHSISCDTCNRWQHTKCVGLTRAQAAEARFKFVCKACKDGVKGKEKAKLERPGSVFPVATIPEDWGNSLVDPAMRKETFISGFAENMVKLGRSLPDEIFMWLLDEICYEPNELLREAYSSVLEMCPQQIFQIIKAEKLQNLFRNLGGTAISTSQNEKLKPVREITDPYPNREWANLQSLIKFLSHAADNLSPKTIHFLICILLRMGADTVVMSNVDLLCIVHEAIRTLCDLVEEGKWNKFCQDITTSIYINIEPAILRFQVTKSIPSSSRRTHDLKRRLAAACFFNDIRYCREPTHLSNDINKYTNHLNRAPEFKIGKQTDFHDVSARISLLDIAVDDGQYTDLDLSSKESVTEHNEDIEVLGKRIRAIWQAVPQDISASLDRKLEAKIAMEVVTYRILYSLPVNKPKKAIFRLKKEEEDLEDEKKGMSLFLKKKLPGAVSV